jgi:hypothetical protein
MNKWYSKYLNINVNFRGLTCLEFTQKVINEVHNVNLGILSWRDYKRVLERLFIEISLPEEKCLMITYLNGIPKHAAICISASSIIETPIAGTPSYIRNIDDYAAYDRRFYRLILPNLDLIGR